MNKILRLLLHSFSTYTILPVNMFLKYDNEKEIVESKVFLPIIGLFIGITATLLWLLLEPFFPKILLILLVVFYMIWVTGAFHEDGFSDAFDAMGFSGIFRKKQLILKIMRDSRIGSFGTLGIFFLLAIKITTLFYISSALIPIALVYAQVVARWSALPLFSLNYPYKENENKPLRRALSKHLKYIPRSYFLISTFFTLGLALYTLGFIGLILFLITTLVSLLTGIFYKAKLNGATGDCYGTTIVLSEIIIYLSIFLLKI